MTNAGRGTLRAAGFGLRVRLGGDVTGDLDRDTHDVDQGAKRQKWLIERGAQPAGT
jgi:hypothetical protein